MDSMIHGHHAATGFSITELTNSLTFFGLAIVEDGIILLNGPLRFGRLVSLFL